jgi:hypothetical protein
MGLGATVGEWPESGVAWSRARGVLAANGDISSP